MAESEEEVKSLLMKVKEESENAGLKLKNTNIMAFNSITSQQIDGETMETVRDYILGGSKIIEMVIAAMKLKDSYSLEEKL